MIYFVAFTYKAACAVQPASLATCIHAVSDKLRLNVHFARAVLQLLHNLHSQLQPGSGVQLPSLPQRATQMFPFSIIIF